MSEQLWRLQAQQMWSSQRLATVSSMFFYLQENTRWSGWLLDKQPLCQDKELWLAVVSALYKAPTVLVIVPGAPHILLQETCVDSQCLHTR